MEQIRQTCQEAEAMCLCDLDPQHDGPHICSCGGSWDYEDGRFIPITMPGPFGELFEGFL